MRRTSGFTLIEMVVALVLTALVALLAYGSAEAGFTSQSRLDDFRREAQAQALMRSIVGRSLRHMAEAPPEASSALSLTRAVDRTGESSEKLTFLTRGVSGPLGAGALWRMTLERRPDGLLLIAVPLDDTDQGPIETRVPGIVNFSARFMRSVADGVWQEEWHSRQAPAAVEISFEAVRGRLPPLLARTSGEFR